MSTLPPEIASSLPRLARDGYRLTSEPTPIYNCVAHAAGEAFRWWWPDPMGVSYWPDAAPREETLAAFVTAFETLGFQVCEQSQIKDVPAIVIYADGSRVPTHVSRTGDAEWWSSKLGRHLDLDHALSGLEGDLYGMPMIYMRLQESVPFPQARPSADDRSRG